MSFDFQVLFFFLEEEKRCLDWTFFSLRISLDCVWALLVLGNPHAPHPPMQCLYAPSVANYLHAPRMVNVEQVWGFFLYTVIPPGQQ